MFIMVCFVSHRKTKNYCFCTHKNGKKSSFSNETPETEQPCNDIKAAGDDIFTLLEKRIELWVADKGFTEQGITIDILAAKLITNHKYLSTHINTRKMQTFRKWINEMTNPGSPLNDVNRFIDLPPHSRNEDLAQSLLPFTAHKNCRQ